MSDGTYADRIARERQRDTEVLADQVDMPSPEAGGSLIVKTVSDPDYPTTAGAYYPVVNVRPGGTEAEGAIPTFTEEDGVFYVLNAGAAIPPVGTMMIADAIGGRWIVIYNG